MIIKALIFVESNVTIMKVFHSCRLRSDKLGRYFIIVETNVTIVKVHYFIIENEVYTFISLF